MLTAESRICPLNRSPVKTERERRDVEMFGKKNKKHPTCRVPERQAASAAALPGPDQKSPELVSLPCHEATTNITAFVFLPQCEASFISVHRSRGSERGV